MSDDDPLSAIYISNDRLKPSELQALFKFHSDKVTTAQERLEEILRMIPESKMPSDVGDVLTDLKNESYLAGEFHGRCVERAEEHKFRLLEREGKQRSERRKRGVA